MFTGQGHHEIGSESHSLSLGPSAVSENCTHPDHIHPPDTLSSGCEACLASGRLDSFHFRVGQESGLLVCGDQSFGRHATRRFSPSAQNDIRSYDPEEDWYRRYVVQLALELQGAPPAPSHP